MKKQMTGLAFSVLIAASGWAAASGAVHWTYSGEEGPGNWARLTPEFGACDGRNQSPVNLTGFIEADLAPIGVAYQAGGSEILNNGHTVQVNYGAGSGIEVDGIHFELKQFHFHAPSENHIDGVSYPMEAHLVHADKDGHLAVIAVMFEEGEENAALAEIWPSMPAIAGNKQALSSSFDAAKLLPENRDYYRFNGSLTTPPCTEGVRWLVMKTPVSASKDQLEAFTHVMHHPNNRPVQPVNARVILK